MNRKLIEIKNLKTYFETELGTAKAVAGVSFDIYRNETLGIVGESGSGKSVTALSLLKLIPSPPGEIVSGEVIYKDIDLLKLDWDEMRQHRGRDIAMIFQEPMTSLNPVFRIDMQLNEIILKHVDIDKKAANKQCIDMLQRVGITDGDKRMKQYPHQLSGGIRQRVMIAMALLNDPALLIADEPTTALDVTIQAQILRLIMELKNKRQDSSILFITHDLAVISEICDRVIVMYGGKIQEVSPVLDLFEGPLHPYTKGLLSSLPGRGLEKKGRLPIIPGNVPSILNMPIGCKFCTRCSQKMDKCETIEPELKEMKPGHTVRCHLY